MIKEKNAIRLTEALDLYNPKKLSIKNLLLSNNYKIESFKYNTCVLTLSNIVLDNKRLIVRTKKYDYLLRNNNILNLDKNQIIKNSNKELKDNVIEATYIYLEDSQKLSEFDSIFFKFTDKKFNFEMSNYESLLSDLLMDEIGSDMFYAIDNEESMYKLVIENLNLLKYNYNLKDKQKYMICILHLMIENKENINSEHYERAKKIITKLEKFKK